MAPPPLDTETELQGEPGAIEADYNPNDYVAHDEPAVEVNKRSAPIAFEAPQGELEGPLSQETLDRFASYEILDTLPILVRDVAIELGVDDDLGVLTEVAKYDDPRRQIWELRKVEADL